MSVRVVAVDPGLTTGVATALVTDDGTIEDFESEELRPEELYRWLALFLAVHASDVQFVSESYTITQQTAKLTQQGWSLEHIGILKYLTWERSLPELVLQAPSRAKHFATDDKLHLMDWWHKGGGGHANDAARHLLTYLVGNHLLPQATLEMLVPA